MLEKIAHIIGVSRQEIRRQMKNNKMHLPTRRNCSISSDTRADGEGK